jgi:hypothetical protein
MVGTDSRFEIRTLRFLIVITFAINVAEKEILAHV